MVYFNVFTVPFFQLIIVFHAGGNCSLYYLKVSNLVMKVYVAAAGRIWTEIGGQVDGIGVKIAPLDIQSCVY